MNTCTVTGCDRTIKNKTLGYCYPHYKRHWRTGDVQAHIPLQAPRSAPLTVIDHEDGTRTCAQCGTRQPLESYHRDKRGTKGRRPTCKACRVEHEMERYNAHPESHRQRIRDFRQANLQHVRDREARYYETHRETRIETAIANSHLRRARIKNNGYERGVTIPALRELHGDTCHYCGTRMTFGRFPKGKRPQNLATLEHLKPISKGGSHTFENCRLSCWACNISKNKHDYPKRLMLIG